MRTQNENLFQALNLVKPAHIIPCLEQEIEIEKLKSTIDCSDDQRDKIRELSFLLAFFRCQRLGGG